LTVVAPAATGTASAITKPATPAPRNIQLEAISRLSKRLADTAQYTPQSRCRQLRLSVI
jgi:hypothetical protein